MTDNKVTVELDDVTINRIVANELTLSIDYHKEVLRNPQSRSRIYDMDVETDLKLIKKQIKALKRVLRMFTTE